MGRLWYIDEDGKRKRTAKGLMHELSRFQSSKKAKKDRAARNKARRQAIREGKAHRGDGTAVDHINSNPRDPRKANLRIISRSENAGRREDSRKRGSRRRKNTWGL